MDELDIKLIRLYNGGESDWMLASHCGVSMRTVQRRLHKLRDNNELSYRYNLVKIQDDDEEEHRISQFDLLKLLALYKTRTEVAKQLGVTPKVITRLCDEYGIEDLKAKSEKLNTILRNLTKKYKPLAISKKHTVDTETLVVDLGDWHIGKIVKDEDGSFLYNTAIARERIGRLLESVLKLLDSHLSKHIIIEEVVILLGGDFANGEDIYPTQAYDQVEAPPKQVMIVVELIMGLIQALLKRDLKVKVYGVKGNHGRLGKDADPASNWDLMVYMVLQYTQMINKIKNLSITYTETEFLTVVIRDKWKYLLRHEASSQDETAGGRAKNSGWTLMHDADLIVSHHVHHWNVNHRRIVNGSTVGRDDLSERMAYTDGEPCQLLWVATDTRSHTNIYPVNLKKERKNIK